jgi:hypothetical protein
VDQLLGSNVVMMTTTTLAQLLHGLLEAVVVGIVMGTLMVVMAVDVVVTMATTVVMAVMVVTVVTATTETTAAMVVLHLAPHLGNSNLMLLQVGNLTVTEVTEGATAITAVDMAAVMALRLPWVPLLVCLAPLHRVLHHCTTRTAVRLARHHHRLLGMLPHLPLQVTSLRLHRLQVLEDLCPTKTLNKAE